jgi:hypothetical protein
MLSLFDQTTYSDVLNRLNKLSPQQKPLWGKMNAGQMLAHCKEAFKVPLSPKKLPRMFIGRLVGWMIKSKLYNDSPWKQNLPTAPNFIIKDERNFENEKAGLIALINQFYKAGPDGISKFPHPMFGTFTPEQWGMSMYKHIDHHLRQFGV